MIHKQLNLNSALISIGCVLATFCLNRADSINSKVIALSATQAAFVERLDRIEKDMVLRSEFKAEIDRIEREIRDEAQAEAPPTHHQRPNTKYQ